MNILEHIKANAKNHNKTIVLPEGTELRTLKAAEIVLKEGLANLVLLGDKEEIRSLIDKQGLKLPNITIINPKTSEKRSAYADLMVEIRKKKGLTKEAALVLLNDPLCYGPVMIKAGDADGELSGAINATGDVLRPAFQFVKTMPGVSVVSGTFMMFLNDTSFGDGGLMFFADCAVMPNPTDQELAEIAVNTARTAKNIAGIEPKVALLSFSTKGSAQNELVDKVVSATAIAKQLAPEFLIDGELQLDAAIVPEVAKLKAPDSKVAGKANILVFPDLQSGNIGYKLVQRLAKAQAVGPILQGMAAPINDLSRGCSVDDIVNMIAITANQAASII